MDTTIQDPMLRGIPQIPSPHHYRGRRTPAGVELVPTVVVVHYTAGKGNELATARLFAQPSRKASAHFCVGRLGGLVQCVALEDGAWHAGDGGRARLPSETQLEDAGPGDLIPVSEVPIAARVMNLRSVGIELCNRGWAKGGKNPYVTTDHRNPASTSTRWESYSEEQLDALVELVVALRRELPSLRWVCGHEDVTHRDTLGAVGGKLDPGPLFPWDMLARTGLRRVAYDFDAHGWRVAEGGCA